MQIKFITDDTKKARDFFLEKISYIISPFELKRTIKNFVNDINIIDVREYDDYIDGHIPYAIHVPYNDLENHFEMIEKDKVNVIYCESEYCSLACKTAHLLASKGYQVRVLAGGFYIWKKLGNEIIKTSTDNNN